MKKLLLTLVFTFLLNGVVFADFVHRDLNKSSNTDCVPASISLISSYSYDEIPSILEGIHQRMGTHSWRSTYTIRHFLYGLGYELCIAYNNPTVSQLADTGVTAIVGIDNPNCHHVVAICNGDYYDKVDTGDYVANFIFVKVEDIERVSQYVDYVWWYDTRHSSIKESINEMLSK